VEKKETWAFGPPLRQWRKLRKGCEIRSRYHGGDRLQHGQAAKVIDERPCSAGDGSRLWNGIEPQKMTLLSTRNEGYFDKDSQRSYWLPMLLPVFPAARLPMGSRRPKALRG
jgi:hypothetical protein